MTQSLLHPPKKGAPKENHPGKIGSRRKWKRKKQNKKRDRYVCVSVCLSDIEKRPDLMISYICLSVRWVYLDLDVHCGYFSRLIQRKDQDAGIDDYDVVDETDVPRIKVSVFMCMCVCVCVCLGFLSDIGRRPNLMISYVCLSVRWVYLDLDIHCGYFSRLLQRKDQKTQMLTLTTMMLWMKQMCQG